MLRNIYPVSPNKSTHRHNSSEEFQRQYSSTRSSATAEIERVGDYYAV